MLANTVRSAQKAGYFTVQYVVQIVNIPDSEMRIQICACMNTKYVICAFCVATEVKSVRHIQPVIQSVCESDIQRRVRLELVGNCGLSAC